MNLQNWNIRSGIIIISVYVFSDRIEKWWGFFVSFIASVRQKDCGVQMGIMVPREQVWGSRSYSNILIERFVLRWVHTRILLVYWQWLPLEIFVYLFRLSFGWRYQMKYCKWQHIVKDQIVAENTFYANSQLL